MVSEFIEQIQTYGDIKLDLLIRSSRDDSCFRLQKEKKPWTGVHGFRHAQVEREIVSTEESNRMSFDFPSGPSFRLLGIQTHRRVRRCDCIHIEIRLLVLLGCRQ